MWSLLLWHSLEAWGCMKWQQGKGVRAALSLPGKLLLRIFPLLLQFKQWKSQAAGEPSLLCLSISMAVAPASVTGSGDVGGKWQCQEGLPVLAL